ncbi:MAG: type II toxin-antitoxin system RelE/ParE family toxin [Spirulina sp.]
MKYIFHPEALTEYARAVEFYAEQNKDLAQEFINSVESAIFKVIEFPLRWPIIEDPVRRCLTRKFPYGILYAVEEDYILIVAVMHGSRKPKYWQERIKTN